MPEYSDVIYTPKIAYVASLNVDNSYGTPQLVEYLQKFDFEFESDTDEIMSGGQIVETLSIPKKGTGTISMAALNFSTLAILAGLSETPLGTTPNRYNTIDVLTGGEGMPYFGIIAEFASTLGGNLLAGFPKAQLSTVPGFTVDQNKFRIGEAEIYMVSPSQTIRKNGRLRKFETASAIPTTAEAFEAFFDGLFD